MTILSEVILLSVLMCFALIVGSLYIGGLSSVLTVTKYEKSLDTITDVVNSGLLWGAHTYSFVFNFLESEDVRFFVYKRL